MRIVLAQINCVVGDIGANDEKIRETMRTILEARTDAEPVVIVFPEMVLLGYHARDILLLPDLLPVINSHIERLRREVPPDVYLVLGAPGRRDDGLYNQAMVLSDGQIALVHDKYRLPNETVFDEHRYFRQGSATISTFRVGDRCLGILVCHDMWAAHPQIDESLDYLLVLNASPYYHGKHEERIDAARAMATQLDCSLVYCNLIGGQDELVFDGGSFMMDRTGSVTAQLPFFTESIQSIDEEHNQRKITPAPSQMEGMYQSIVLAIRDFFAKSDMSRALVGLSGGIDSALVLFLAVRALGAERVAAVMLPSRYTSQASVENAQALADQMGVSLETLSIEPMFQSAEQTLSAHIQSGENEVTYENVQSRIRGLLLMALANDRHALVLATMNKSEVACGYGTLYGDIIGGYAPICDVTKTQVWQLARYINDQSDIEVIPPQIIERAPSAELREDQTDQDTLPPYEVIDAVLESMYRTDEAARQDGIDEALREDIFSRIRRSEFKRKQSPIGPIISEGSFGLDWRMPIAGRYRLSAMDKPR